MSLDDSMLGESISCSIQSSSQPDMSDATWHHRTSSFHSAESDEAYGSDKSGKYRTPNIEHRTSNKQFGTRIYDNYGLNVNRRKSTNRG